MSDFAFWQVSGQLNHLSDGDRAFLKEFLIEHPELDRLNLAMIKAILLMQSEQGGAALGYSERDSLRRIRELYTEIQGVAPASPPPSHHLAQAFGDDWGFVRGWLNQIPDSVAVESRLLEDPALVQRLRFLVARAPFVFSVIGLGPLLDTDCTGELALTDSIAKVAHWGRVSDLKSAVVWTLDSTLNLSERRLGTVETLLRHVLGRLCASFDVLLCGRHVEGTATLDDPIEVVVVSPHDEAQLSEIENFWMALNQAGFASELKIGMRFGGYEQLRRYELESMTLAERFSVRTVQSVWGSPDAEEMVRRLSVALPLTPERLKALAEVKRHQISQIMPQHRHRHVTEGVGALGDIEWFVRLHEMRFPTATRAGQRIRLSDRIRQLAQAKLINAVEQVELLEALEHLVALRHTLVLMGYSRDIIPENPRKLGTLAERFGYADGNDLLAYHERVTATVHTIFSESLERLKA